MIDPQGYRSNVGIILSNTRGQVLWAKRIRQDAWQFPQGGIHRTETPEQALYRELSEEVGLDAEDVEVMGRTRGWLRYRLPARLVRRREKPVCIGQKQVWFMLRLLSDDAQVRLDLTDQPEFDSWCWVPYWQPLDEIVSFKREVYRQALLELAPLLPGPASHTACARSLFNE